jgi:hypothetical protein
LSADYGDEEEGESDMSDDEEGEADMSDDQEQAVKIDDNEDIMSAGGTKYKLNKSSEKKEKEGS